MLLVCKGSAINSVLKEYSKVIVQPIQDENDKEMCFERMIKVSRDVKRMKQLPKSTFEPH